MTSPDPNHRAEETSREPSTQLLERAQAGDHEALDALCQRYLPLLRDWAHRRLPVQSRSLLDTDDLVQDTVLRALSRLSNFEYRREGALLAYLRTVLQNRVRDEIRRVRRRPAQEVLDTNRASPREPSPLDALLSKDEHERYEAALAELRDVDREAIIARLEMDLPYERVADLLGRPSVGAARTAVSRAVYRLAEVLGRAAP